MIVKVFNQLIYQIERFVKIAVKGACINEDNNSMALILFVNYIKEDVHMFT